MWGGAYNAIIPVFRSHPSEWREDPWQRLTGAEITQGYVKFFEPDAVVEAEPNLLEKSGLGTLRNRHREGERVFPLRELLSCQDHRDWSELTMGLEIIDILKHIHKTERRFELRDPQPAFSIEATPRTTFVEAMFGVYPTDKATRHIAKMYFDVFKARSAVPTPELWKNVYMHGAVTPLVATHYALEHTGTQNDDLLIYVFDATRTVDLIDLWNLRLEAKPLLPIPTQWWSELVGEVERVVQRQHRPLQGNPHGVMHRTTIELARSIGEERGQAMLAMLSPELPADSWGCKTWRTRIWSEQTNAYVGPTRALRVTAQEKHVSLTVREDDTSEFQSLAPSFASLYGGGQRGRWANVVDPDSSTHRGIATVVPFNVTDASWPRLDRFGPVVVGSEGWSFNQRFKEFTTTIQLQTQEQAVIGSLERLGVHARLSDAGHIAKQVLHHLGGTWGIRLLADLETLKLLNGMAGGVRRTNDGAGDIEEVFDRRVRSERTWKQLIATRLKRRRYEEMAISHFTDRNMIRLGLTTKCPQCTESNWHSLTDADYAITCARCLEKYPFPQGSLQTKNVNWGYRVIGPFAAPDYARGAYGALLALNVLVRTSFWGEVTLSPALVLEWDGGTPCEADYVAWIGRKSFAETHRPQLVIGEAKSLGSKDLVKSHDLGRLRSIARKLPGATIVISVMREEFTESERHRLRSFAKWAARLDKNRNPTNQVVLLTGVELFHQLDLSSTWKNRGGRHAQFAKYDYTHDLQKLAEATQTLYLS